MGGENVHGDNSGVIIEGLEGHYHLVRLPHHCHHAVNCYRPDASGWSFLNKTWCGLNGRRMRRIKFDGDYRSLCKNIFFLFVPKHDFDILLTVSKVLVQKLLILVSSCRRGTFYQNLFFWPDFAELCRPFM